MMDYPRIEIEFRDMTEYVDDEISPYDAMCLEGWYWTECGYNGFIGSGAGPFNTKENAEADVAGYLAMNGDLPIIEM